MMKVNKQLIAELKCWFEQFPGTVTAFSGGIDSALVLFLSRKFLGRDNAIGVISNSESLKGKDYELALDFARKNDIVLETIKTEELIDENYNSNPSNRCYFCKSHLYDALSKVKVSYPGFIVLNGTNKDDFKDYRPGLKAADENEVRSPLADLGVTKVEVRELAKYFGIPFWNKPASPCLSSRVPYGENITKNKLAQIEKVEEILNEFGFEDVRVRHYGEECKIEVPIERLEHLKDVFKVVLPEIQKTGFKSCVIDNEGLVSGKLNKYLVLDNE